MSEIEAATTAKLATWKLQHLGLWVDIVEPPATPPKVLSAVEVMELQDEVATAKFREIRAKLAQDTAAMCKFNADKEEITRRSHVVKVMFEKSQIEIGKEFLGWVLFNFCFAFLRGCHFCCNILWCVLLGFVWFTLFVALQRLARLCETFMERNCRVSLLCDKNWLDPKIDATYRSAALASKAREQIVKTFWNHPF